MSFSIWKKRGRGILALLLVFLLVTVTLPVTASAENIAAVTTETVHLRAGKGTHTDSIKIVSKGTSVTVTDMSNSDWYGVKLSDGKTGYICAEYIGVSAEIPAKTNEYVNLRSGAGTNYSSKLVVKQGTELTVTSTENSKWYAVRLNNGTTGYIYSIYLDLGNTSASTPTATPEATTKPNATAAPSATASPASGTTAVTTAAVHLRSGPSTAKASKGVIASGTTVMITEKTNSEWYAVALADGRTGYIYAKYLREQSTSAGTAVKGRTTTYVNLRSGAGTGYYSKGVIKTGTELTVTNRSNPQWYAVKLSDGRTGYMYSIYVEIIGGTAATATPKPTAQPTATAAPTATPTAAPTVTPEPDADKVIMKTTTAINFRKGPGTSYERIQVVSGNVEVTVLAVAENAWYKVQLKDGTKGYLLSDYLKLVSGNLNTLPKDEGHESTGDAVSPDDGATEVAPSDTEYVRTTVSGLNLRTGAGTSYARVKLLGAGTVLEVLARTDNGWVKVKMTDGTEGYVSADYVAAYDPSSADAQLPQGAESLPQYKTLYMDADVSGTVYWSSSNPSVATVDSGSGSQIFVYGAQPGTADIIAKNASGKVLTSKTVTVTAPEAVRFAYTTPNIISAGEPFALKAVTDSGKTAVKFEIVGGAGYETKQYEEESQGDNRIRVFSAEAVLNQPGTYTVRAYSDAGSGYSKTYREFTILVVSTTDRTTTSNESRRISDEMLNAVALFEGYYPEVYADNLAGNIPTVGYGYVVNENTTFYNNLTRTEAWAMLADTLNRRGYTTELNKFIDSNDILMNQHQFDALVSFSYNVGSGYWNSTTSCYLRTILKENTFAMPQNLSASNPLSGKTAQSNVAIYTSHSGSSTVLKTLSSGQTVEIIEYYRNNDTTEAWYQVKSGSVTGWVRSGNITITNTTGLTRDLAYVDSYTFCNNLLDWHKAGGRCIKGLLTRRVAEAKVFSHGNYAEATKGHPNYYTNTYNYDIPTCV